MPMATVHAMNLKYWVAPTIRLATTARATEDDGTCSKRRMRRLRWRWHCPGACDCEGNLPEPGYTCEGDCIADSDGDGICNPFEVPGCTDETAYASPRMPPMRTARVNTPLRVSCAGNCLADHDGDGICNDAETPGCTSISATNYNPATDDDGSCTWPKACSLASAMLLDMI